MINFNKKTIQITLDSFTEGKVTAGETWNDSAYDKIKLGAELTYSFDGCKYSVKGDVDSTKEDCINLLKEKIPQIIFDEWFEENWTKEFSDFGLDDPKVYDFEEGRTNAVKGIGDFVNNCSFDDCYDEVIEQLKEVASKEYEVEIDGVVVSASKESSDLETRLFNLKQQRNIFYSFRCYPRPKSSPYDEEIKEIEEILKKEAIE